MKIPLSSLEGVWHITHSNFPMWLKGDKLHPTFNYSLETKGQISGLRDEVRYLKKGKWKSILGFDSPQNEACTRFQWRGKGLLNLLSSNWEILHMSEEQAWMLIAFKKTLFTPAGYDVVAREERLSSKQSEEIQTVLEKLGISENLAVLT